MLHKRRIEATGPAAQVLTEERIAPIYAAHVIVSTGADGTSSR